MKTKIKNNLTTSASHAVQGNGAADTFPRKLPALALVLFAISAGMLPAEAKAGKPTPGKRSLPDRIEDKFKSLDANQDGKVSLDEFKAGTKGAASEKRFHALDKNQDGFLTEGEFAKIPAKTQEKFEKLDANKDGHVSLEEFKSNKLNARKADKQFSGLDKNKDGTVSLLEYSQHRRTAKKRK